MSVSTAHSTVDGLLDSFADATPGHLDEDFLRLVDAVWAEGRLTGLAAQAVPAILARIDQVGDDRRGRLLVLLGLLAEAEYPATDGEVTSAVREGLDTYLDLLSRGVKGEPQTLALLYLLSHLPKDRERILAAAAPLHLDPNDQTRLERCLQELDPENVVLGRVWPSPYEWSLSDDQREFDQGWIRTLTPEQLRATWESDTRTVLAYVGAKAYWAVLNGSPTVASDTSPYSDTSDPVDAAVDAEIFDRYAEAYRCPACHSPLEFAPSEVRCTGCSTAYATTHGVIDVLTALGGAPADDPDDVLQNATKMKGIGYYYEAVLRPAFLQVMGSNWGGQVSPTDEDAYLARHTRPVDGPVLDLAAGAGRWTAVLCEAVGAERVIALDVIMPMLIGVRGRLPEVQTLRASALALPFDDATLGAVNCWNALQALPDPHQALKEVGRCLRPGGVLTLLTFRWGSDGIYSYFQGAHAFPGSPDGIKLFDLDQISGWLDDAGLTVREQSGPGTFVFITAERAL
jgi:SAM-dependent methyltransferase